MLRNTASLFVPFDDKSNMDSSFKFQISGLFETLSFFFLFYTLTLLSVYISSTVTYFNLVESMFRGLQICMQHSLLTPSSYRCTRRLSKSAFKLTLLLDVALIALPYMDLPPCPTSLWRPRPLLLINRQEVLRFVFRMFFVKWNRIWFSFCRCKQIYYRLPSTALLLLRFFDSK